MLEKYQNEITAAREQKEFNTKEAQRLSSLRFEQSEHERHLIVLKGELGAKERTLQAGQGQLEADRAKFLASQETALQQARSEADGIRAEAKTEAEKIKARSGIDAWLRSALAVPATLDTADGHDWLSRALSASGVDGMAMAHMRNLLGAIATLEARASTAAGEEAKRRTLIDLGNVLIMAYPTIAEIAAKLGPEGLSHFAKLYSREHRLGIKILLPGLGDPIEKKTMNAAANRTRVSTVKCWGYMIAGYDGLSRPAEVD